MPTRSRTRPKGLSRPPPTGHRRSDGGLLAPAARRRQGSRCPTRDAKRLRKLEKENSTLKRLLAIAELDKGRPDADRPGKLLSLTRRRAAVGVCPGFG